MDTLAAAQKLTIGAQEHEDCERRAQAAGESLRGCRMVECGTKARAKR